MTEIDPIVGNPDLESKVDDPALARDIPANAVDECSKNETIKVFLKPEIVNSTAIAFKIPEHEGMELQRDQKIIFVIPPEFSTMAIREIILGHRKNASKFGGYNENKRDPNGAYSNVTALDSKTGKWVGWHDKYGSVKFAEPRSTADPEEENLHDFINCAGVVTPEAICLENTARPNRPPALDVSMTTSNIHYLTINFYPELDRPIQQKEAVYTEGTAFSDLPIPGQPIVRTTPKYGDYHGGDISTSIAGYPNSVPLSRKGWEPPFTVNESPDRPAHFVNEELHIDLEPGNNLKYVEVSCGDTIAQRPGKPSRNGGARLNMGLKKATGEILWFANNINVPPKGVLNGSLQNPDYIIEPGDQLVLKSTAYHTTYVMAWRLTYARPKTEETAITYAVETDQAETSQQVEKTLSDEEEIARRTQLAIDKFFGEKDALL